MISPVSRLLGFFFGQDAEGAHELALALTRGAAGVPGLLRCLGGGAVRATQPSVVTGVEFINPVGLAAGFDKNAEWLPYLPQFGFGFVEIGTVTPRPQGGNPRPRLFRSWQERKIVNRMGFNNLGAAVIAERVHRARPKLPAGFKIGINIGKNRTTELDQAAADYAAAVRPFAGGVDFVVINVSSPNTPGLRELQALEHLKLIVQAVQAEMQQWATLVPIWLKLSPEFVLQLQGDTSAGPQFGHSLESFGVSALVLTNTLANDQGGVSGAPLTVAARQALESMRQWTRLPLISVGGILDQTEAQARLDAGASLVEIYSGWIFGGPRFARRLARGLKAAQARL